MLHVTATIEPSETATHDAMVEQIMVEYEPIVVRQRQAMANAWHDWGVTKIGLVLLMHLENHGPLPMSRLAELADASQSSMTGIIDRLEEQHLVERIRDEHDRRVVLAQATPQGQAAIAAWYAAWSQIIRDILSSLDDTDRGTCLSAFRIMRQAADRMHITPAQHP
jgi:DNA-binding MarR family transcriptional regulator